MSNLGIRVRNDASVRIDPRVVLGSHLLRLTQTDLAQAIEAELAENPALEQLHDDFEPLQDDHILASVAPNMMKSQREDYEFSRSSCETEEYTDWVDYTPAVPCLRDHLLAQILPRVPARFAALATYVVESVGDKGYLEDPDEEIALATGEDLDHVELVVKALQSCEPAGIGARNLMECLILQLRQSESVEQRLARTILKSRMDDFLARRVSKIARRYNVSAEVVAGAFDEISKLTPYPGQAFSVSRNASSSKSIASPDIVISRTDQNWCIEVKGPESTSFQISRPYQVRAQQLKHASLDDRDEKRHVTHYVQRANDFVSSLEQRANTLRLIGEYLLQHQTSFLNTGSYQFLQPLTRSRLAADIGLHESTVSRATADKFVQLPTGTIVSFDVFFKPALRVQKMIEEILATENPGNPLSDDRISELLRDRGVHVARRTVNKYRDRTKLLSSRKRHTA